MTSPTTRRTPDPTAPDSTGPATPEHSTETTPVAEGTVVEREALATLAARIAQSVGRQVLDMRESGVNLAGTKSSDTDVVTAADHEAERLITSAIVEARPHDAILGEEGASRPGTSGITWVIDPIDGTVNYLYNIPAYAVSIAATVADPAAFADGRRAIAGAVAVPASEELFVAYQGGGATRNGAPIHVSQTEDLGLALIATGFGYSVERRTEQAEVVARMIPRVRDIRRIGSCAYDLCLVASGRIDGYYERGIQPWDYAAAALIASEAGADLLGKDPSTPPGEPLLIAGNPALAQEIHSVIAGGVTHESTNEFTDDGAAG